MSGPACPKPLLMRGRQKACNVTQNPVTPLRFFPASLYLPRHFVPVPFFGSYQQQRSSCFSAAFRRPTLQNTGSHAMNAGAKAKLPDQGRGQASRRSTCSILQLLLLFFCCGAATLAARQQFNKEAILFAECPGLRGAPFLQRELQRAASEIAETTRIALSEPNTTFGSFENKELSSLAVRELWWNENCVTVAATVLGVRPFELQIRPVDRALCNVGVWQNGCQGFQAGHPKKAFWQFAEPERLLAIEQAVIGSTISQRAQCPPNKDRVYAFNMLVSDASWKGFAGISLIKSTIKALAQHPSFLVSIHIDTGSTLAFTGTIHGLVTSLKSPRVVITGTSLRSSWGSSELAAAELIGLATLIQLADRNDVCWEHVVNLDGATMLLGTPEATIDRLEMLEAGVSYLNPLDSVSIYRKNASFTPVPNGFLVPGYVRHPNGPSPTLRARDAGWPDKKYLQSVQSGPLLFYNMSSMRASQWRVLSLTAAKYLVTSPAVSTFFDQFARYLFAPDEGFIPTVLSTVGAPLHLGQPVHYIGSQAKGNGRYMREHQFRKINGSTSILGRKFQSLSQWEDFIEGRHE